MNKQYVASDMLYSHSIDNAHSIKHFKYETHNNQHELYIFYRGHTDFRVEGCLYSLNPGDIMIVNHMELHKPYHIKPYEEYERAVITINRNFFIQNNCEELEYIFTQRPIGTNNYIPAEITKNSNIHSIIKSIDYYIEKYGNPPEYIINGKIMELLFLLSNLSSDKQSSDTSNVRLKTIIDYINTNITSPLTLSSISERFFYNKQYLCRLFKSHTGMTINEYIVQKRIILVSEMYAMGTSLSEACLKAGFSSYSNFYKLYRKFKNKSPKEDLYNHKTT